jgi:lysophospholipase L1-like esterase
MLGAALACALLALALPSAAGAAAKRPAEKLYVALGDSYATGWQATGPGRGSNTRNGYPYQVPGLAAQRGHRLRLVNFGCGGATTFSLMRQTVPCAPRARAIGGPSWGGRTQLAAAERYLRANRGRVGLVTVSIGGNDVTKCARVPQPIPCVGTAVEDIKANVGAIARRLRAAAGPGVTIVGTTYPNVILGQWVTGAASDQELARLSVVAFQQLINPALKAAYARAGGRFADVTARTGAYGSLEETVEAPPYGVVPKPVAEVCRITYYCQFRDIHLTTPGYRIIAELVAAALPRRR